MRASPPPPTPRVDVALYRRGQFITALTRLLSVALGVLCLALMWENPKTHAGAAMAVVGGYGVFAVATALWPRGARPRGLKVAHDVADALAVGLGAAVSGGLESPIWLLLYPHVVAVSVRGGLAYALAMGLLDAVIVGVLTVLTPQQPLGMLHALALLFCAFMGGTTSSYLHSIQRRLAGTNEELSRANEQLSRSVSAHEAARREQEHALGLLTASEARYRRLLEGIQDGVAILEDNRIVYANPVFASMVGDAPEALAGADFRELLPPEDRHDVAERYARWRRAAAVPGVLESRLRTRRGATLLVSVRAGSVEFEGRPSVIMTVRDITRERRMEQDLKAHAERLAALNEIASAVNLSLTIEDIFKVAAEEARRLVAFDRLTLALFDQEDGPVEIVAVAEGVARQRAPFGRAAIAWALRRPQAWAEGAGEEAPPHVEALLAHAEVRAVATLPLLSKDRVIGCLNLGRSRATPFSTYDLAVLEPVARHIAIALDNARLLEAVRRRSHELESMLEIGRHIGERLGLEELLALVTRSVNRVMGTHHCLLLLREGEALRVVAEEGMEPEVVQAFRGLRIGDSLTGWVIQRGRVLAIDDMRQDPRLMFGELVQRFAYRSYLGAPLRRGAETIGALEVVTKHEPRRFGPEDQALMAAFADQAAVAIDNARLLEDARAHLTSVVDANRRLEELDRLRRDYLRNVSHEFRSPLTIIKGYAESLMETGPPAEGLREAMRVIAEGCDRVIDLVDTLIEVSRVEQDGAEETLLLQRLDLREVAEASLDGLRASADRKGVAVSLEFPDDGLSLEADRGLLHQLVRKLVDNAVKYSARGQRVLVRGRADGDVLTLEVEDRGIGIGADHVGRIFEKFYMVDGSTTRRAGGTGVGLYLVREIVRLHHGTVAVESRPGQGSTFRVRLPRRAGPPARASA